MPGFSWRPADYQADFDAALWLRNAETGTFLSLGEERVYPMQQPCMGTECEGCYNSMWHIVPVQHDVFDAFSTDFAARRLASITDHAELATYLR